MKHVLVTGGAGFVGSHIVSALVRRGDKVRVLDNLCTGFRSNLEPVLNDIEFLEGDVADESTMARAVQGVEVVFHQAALASVPMSLEQPLVTNHACVTGTLNLLHQSSKAGVRRVVYAASSSAYGNLPFVAKRETDLPQVLSPYAAAKLAGELYCQAYYHSFGLETVGLRYFNVYGPRQDPASPYSAVIPLFVTAILSGRQPIVFGDGGQSRDFVFVEDVVQGNLLAASVDDAAGKVFNIAEGRQTSLLRLLEVLSTLLGVDIQPDFQPSRPGDVRESLADTTLARTCLGYEPQADLETGLKRTIDYYRHVAEAKLAKHSTS